MIKNEEELEKKGSWLTKELERERKVSIRSLDGIKEQEEPRSSTSDPFFVADLILFSLLLPFSVGISSLSLFPVLLLFCFLLPGLVLWECIFKKFPPTWYFAIALMLTVILEIMGIMKAK